MGTLNLRRRRTALAAGLATFAMAASLAAAPAQAVDKTKYIALGDSYAAGQGAGPYKKNDSCYRSDNAYSELVAEVKAIKLVTNAACSGMKTSDVVKTQLQKLNKSTELVTITAGGNDIGFGDIVTKCVTAIFDVRAAADCEKVSKDATEMMADGELTGNLIGMITSVRAAAPNAKIVVTGYPYLYDPVPAGRTDPLSLFIYQAKDLADGLNGSIAAAVNKTDPGPTNHKTPRVQYVDVRGAFAGHGIISADPWINLDFANPSSPDNFHPNALGYQAYYTALSKDGAYSAP